jgi:hypothetical protein
LKFRRCVPSGEKCRNDSLVIQFPGKLSGFIVAVKMEEVKKKMLNMDKNRFTRQRFSMVIHLTCGAS